MSENGVVTAPEGTAAAVAEAFAAAGPDNSRTTPVAPRLLAHGVATCMILGEA